MEYAIGVALDRGWWLGVAHLLHPEIINNPGVPEWWPAFCLAYDITAAAYLGVLIRVRGVHNAVT